MAAKLAENTKPCPFCDSTDIHYSTKSVNNNGICIIHAACFCNNCNTYGPRVLSKHINRTNYTERELVRNSYTERELVRNSSELKNQAIEKWNTRTT